jgi:hypothetical protein
VVEPVAATAVAAVAAAEAQATGWDEGHEGQGTGTGAWIGGGAADQPGGAHRGRLSGPDAGVDGAVWDGGACAGGGGCSGKLRGAHAGVSKCGCGCRLGTPSGRADGWESTMTEVLPVLAKDGCHAGDCMAEAGAEFEADVVEEGGIER